MEIFTQVINGEIPEQQLDRIREFAQKLKKGNLWIEVLSTKPKSKQQRDYMHGVVFKHVADFIGCSKDEAKQIVKEEFLTVDMVDRHGTYLGKRVRGTEELNCAETEAFLKEVRQEYALRGCYIPEPNEPELIEPV